MSVVFLTPLGALLAVATVVPLVALWRVRKRAALVRTRLRLPQLPPRRVVVPALAVASAGGLVALAATQPVLQRTLTREVRSDAEAYVVVDVSRSMLASARPGSRSRLARAKTAAVQVREALPGVRVGIASLTDRVLPHLFPSSDDDVFRATLARVIAIERPPPRSSFQTNATSLDALAAVPVRQFFAPTAAHRLLVVLTDGESAPVNNALVARRLARRPRTGVVFVHVWDGGERVFTRGVAEPQYRPDPTARTILDRLAETADGSVHAEGDLEAAGRAGRDALGEGPTVARGERRTRHALGPYLAAAAFLPLSLLLVRRAR